MVVIFLGLPDVAIQVQQPLGKLFPGCPAIEDQVVAVLHLPKEKTMLAAGLLALLVGDERRKRCAPLLSASRSRAVSGPASSCHRAGLPLFRNALADCWKSIPSGHMRIASQ
jgi:hypothetical protein